MPRYPPWKKMKWDKWFNNLFSQVKKLTKIILYFLRQTLLNKCENIKKTKLRVKYKVQMRRQVFPLSITFLLLNSTINVGVHLLSKVRDNFSLLGVGQENVTSPKFKT